LEGRASYGGDSWNAALEGKHKRELDEHNGDKTERGTTLGRLRADLRLGKAPTGRNPDDRVQAGVEITGQFERHDSEYGPRDPKTSRDATGRFETLTEFFGGESDGEKAFGSVSIDLKWPSRSLLKFTGYGGREFQNLLENYKFTVTDLTGQIPNPIEITPNPDTRVEVDNWGAELLLGAGNFKSLGLLMLGGEGGHIRTDNGTSVTADDYFEFRAGVLGDFYPVNRVNLSLGAFYSGASVENGDERKDQHELDLSISSVLGFGSHFLLAPHFGGVAHFDPEKPPLFRGGAIVGIGLGNEGASQNVWAVGQYNLDRVLREHSGQYTPEANEMMDEWAWHNLLSNIQTDDLYILLRGDVSQMHDADGKKTLGAHANAALIIPLNNGEYGKLIFDGYFHRVPEGNIAGGRAGYHIGRFFANLGGEYRHGELLNPDGKETGGRATGSVGFKF
jgi:hypothetical protein